MPAERKAAVGPSRLVGIEGLRAIAAGSIVAYHVWLYGAPSQASVNLGLLDNVFSNLRAGVTLFFTLSGFLLFRPYVAAALRDLPTPELRGYLRNRALRIVPAYWVTLILVAILLERTLVRHPQQLLANLFLLQNYVPDYLFGAGIVPAWSLAIEVVFYLAVPILGGYAIVLARRRGLSPTRAAFVPVLVMFAVGFAAKAVARLASPGDVWEYTFLTHADWFAPGMAVAVLRVRWEDGRLHLPRGWRPVAVLGAVALTLVGVVLYHRGILDYVEYQTPIAVGCGLILALVVFADPGCRLLRILTWRPLVAAGLASYSLFLWHDPLLRFLRSEGSTFSGTGGFVVNLLLVYVLAGAVSAVSYRLVEKPALARKHGWLRDAKPSSPVPASSVEPELPAAAAAPAPGV